MAYSAASPVAEAVFARLQDATLLAALPGGWHDDVPQNPTFPFGWYEIPTETDARGLGTGGLPRIDLRTHVFSEVPRRADAQEANRLTIAVLKDQALSVTGYAMCGHIFFRESLMLEPQLLNGVKVHEIVSIFECWVEEA